jgi:thiamine-phosphate pyrophosphorylase
MQTGLHGLYLVTPDWDDTDRLVAATDAALAAGAALLQYRHKEAAPQLRREQAGALLALCRRHGVPFIVNDHLDLCAELDADGIHVGGLDAGVAAARAALGPDKIVGASCYGDLARAVDAQAAGASYVAFGGFYPSRVKKYAVTTQPAILAQARAAGVTVPTVVIGGMTPANAAVLVTAGADMVAAISSVYGSVEKDGDVASAVQAFTALFSRR